MASNTILEQAPPHNLEAEASVLGAMLLDNDCIPDVLEVLGKDKTHFYRTANQEVFEAIVHVYETQQKVDLVILTDEMRRRGMLESVGGTDYLMSLEDTVPTAANAPYYAKIVSDKAVKRNLIATTTQILRDAHTDAQDLDTLLDATERRIFAVTEKKVSANTVRIEEILKQTCARIDSFHERGARLRGLPTGFYDLDDILSGLQPSEMIIVAARPSIGKTSLVLNIAEHVAVVEQKAVAVFTLEMSGQQVAQNMLCSHARIDAHDMRRGMLKDSQWQQLSMAIGTLSEAPILIDDTPGLSALELRAKGRRLKAHHQIGLLCIDYLQLMEARHAESRQQEISEISRGIKSLARELEIPIIAVSQLNRAVEAREGHRPRMSDLRESGSIEQDADVILMLHRDDYYDPNQNPGMAEVIVAKQRNGPTGDIKLAFRKQYMRFESAARGNA